ncbi:hypothetical protein TgHK011_009760 [Trichoderma gracile]|nr:hypothetical protein TgHK011_009760 [Trichoderma gracile]
MDMQLNEASAGLAGPIVTAGTALGPPLDSVGGMPFANPSTPTMLRMPMQVSTPMPSIPSTPLMHQMHCMQPMAKDMPMNVGTHMDSNTATNVNQNPNMTLSMPPPPHPRTHRSVADGHRDITINQPIAKQPRKHAPGSGIIAQPREQFNKTATTALAPQHNARVAKRQPSMHSAKEEALLRAMVPAAWGPTSVEVQAPVQHQPTAAPEALFIDEAIVVDEAPPPAPAPTSEAAPAGPNLEDTPAARAVPPEIEQERLDKLLVCRHWSWNHKISLCQQVEIMAGNRGKDRTTWCQRLLKRYESGGLWNVYEIDGFLYEVDFKKGEAKGIPRREYIKMVDAVRMKCCAPMVEEMEEGVDQKDEKDEVKELEEESEEDEGEAKEEDADKGDEEGKGQGADEEASESHEERDGGGDEDGDGEEDRVGEEQEEEGVEEMELVQELEAQEVSKAESTRSFLDLLDDNGDVLPLEAWGQELRDRLSV